jgi:hypothetical protein
MIEGDTPSTVFHFGRDSVSVGSPEPVVPRSVSKSTAEHLKTLYREFIPTSPPLWLQEWKYVDKLFECECECEYVLSV